MERVKGLLNSYLCLKQCASTQKLTWWRRAAAKIVQQGYHCRYALSWIFGSSIRTHLRIAGCFQLVLLTRGRGEINRLAVLFFCSKECYQLILLLIPTSIEQHPAEVVSYPDPGLHHPLQRNGSTAEHIYQSDSLLASYFVHYISSLASNVCRHAAPLDWLIWRGFKLNQKFMSEFIYVICMTAPCISFNCGE